MDKHEIDNRRRSLVMLSPRAPALDREYALDLIGELQRVQARLERLRDELRKLAEGWNVTASTTAASTAR